MRVQGAVICEQGQSFAVVAVKPHFVQNRSEAANAISGFTPVFGVPVVLMAQDSHGRPTYYGRPDSLSSCHRCLFIAFRGGSTRSI
jgi:hypothetical protein